VNLQNRVWRGYELTCKKPGLGALNAGRVRKEDSGGSKKKRRSKREWENSRIRVVGGEPLTAPAHNNVLGDVLGKRRVKRERKRGYAATRKGGGWHRYRGETI